MTVRKLLFIPLLPLLLLLCALISQCGGPEQSHGDFFSNTENGAYNAVRLELGETRSVIYYIEEGYGILTDSRGQRLVACKYGNSQQDSEGFSMTVATNMSYYQAVAMENNETALLSYNEYFLGGQLTVDKSGTEGKLLIYPTYAEGLSLDPDAEWPVTKIKLPEEKIIPLETAIKEMNYVPKAYADFFADRENFVFSCELGHFKIDGATMTGEWHTDGTVIPVRLERNGKVPYFKLYDTSRSPNQTVLKGYLNFLDPSSAELIDYSGELFFTNPTKPVVITKTAK